MTELHLCLWSACFSHTVWKSLAESDCVGIYITRVWYTIDYTSRNFFFFIQFYFRSCGVCGWLFYYNGWINAGVTCDLLNLLNYVSSWEQGSYIPPLLCPLSTHTFRPLPESKYSSVWLSKPVSSLQGSALPFSCQRGSSPVTPLHHLDSAHFISHLPLFPSSASFPILPLVSKCKSFPLACAWHNFPPQSPSHKT